MLKRQMASAVSHKIKTTSGGRDLTTSLLVMQSKPSSNQTLMEIMTELENGISEAMCPSITGIWAVTNIP